MIKKLLLFSVFIFVLQACEDFEDVSPYKVYTIKEGKHSSNGGHGQLSREFLAYEVVFNESAIYTTTDPNNQADINKLFGFSDCGSIHSTNSARFGWRWYQDQLELMAFVHYDEDIRWKSIAVIDFDKPYKCFILLKDDVYEFGIEGVTTSNVSMDRNPDVCNKGFYYQLWPYFGGDETAPHEITIAMRQVFK
jgi:hypothetical protein